MGHRNGIINRDILGMYVAQHLGCYNDNIERALPNYANCTQEPRCKCDFTNSGCLSDTAMTIELCKDICCNGATKFAFAGVEAGNQCFCGVATTNYKRWTPNELALPNTDCHVQCVGNPTESCGADYKINVYGCNVGCEIPGSLSANLVATPPLVVKLYDIGDTINFRCLEGSMLTGEPQIICQTGGGWSGAVPRCQDTVVPPPGTTCTQPIAGSNVFFSPRKSSYNIGDTVFFSCATRFQLNGGPTLRCQTGGVWGTIPTCTQSTACGPLTGLDPNAIPSTLANDIGTTVTFTCAEGFVMLAGTNPSKVCGATGWTGPNPVCQTVTCSKPQVPDRTTYSPIKDTYASGDIITIQCELGYRPSGPTEVTCTNAGQWSDIVLQCTGIICDPLPTYPNVIPSTMETTFATSVSFRCETGYNMTSNQIPYRTCHTDGWVGPLPECSVIECGAVPQYPNADASTTGVVYRTLVSYTCRTGYRTIDRNPVIKTCQTSGNWEPPDAVNCQIVDCGTLPSYANAFPSESATFYGTVVTYKCHPGFALTGNIIVSKRCTEQGTWTGPNPVCEPTVCSPLPLYPFAVPSTTSTAVNTEVLFTCRPGAMVTGSSPKLTCQADGKWNGTVPDCIEINECASAPCKNGAPCVDLLNKYVCNCSPGFSGTNCETIGGGSGGGNATSCNAVPVFDHAIPSNTTMTEVSTTITYECEVGYQHNGNSPYKQCLPTGIWDGQSPLCLPVNCGTPEVPPYLSIGTAQDFTFGQTITYMCTDRTKSPSPYATIMCESTKLWSKPPPAQCLVTTVTNPPEVTPTSNMIVPGGDGNTTVPTGGIDGNSGGTGGINTSGGLPVSIWIVILIILIALGMFLLGIILVRRQHEDAKGDMASLKRAVEVEVNYTAPPRTQITVL
ncbi:sushi, von Willebrand factor type A, EGF and pentraxin domain-containing protein 1-like [Amphiura filiformis]|uniref:sushi, von Willebrand factor type A, EGF and pentraxin domain-containing protein 1-like n=1 Tax=Amphiura filiformis TaxID=82378 RepID=UPI003B20BF9D